MTVTIINLNTFQLKHVVNMDGSEKQLNRECSLFCNDGKHVIVAAAIFISDDLRPHFYELYTNNESITTVTRLTFFKTVLTHNWISDSKLSTWGLHVLYNRSHKRSDLWLVGVSSWQDHLVPQSGPLSLQRHAGCAVNSTSNDSHLPNRRRIFSISPVDRSILLWRGSVSLQLRAIGK